jgi:lipopolysaccharide transport system ATP-binding protein
MSSESTTPETTEYAIEVNGLGKCYQIYDKPSDRLKQMLMRGRKQYYKEFWALKDVSFKIKKGETVGIIGRNGSGKSTLLQMICGTLNPTGGEVKVNGRVAALLELGAGFNPEFSGVENVYMAASLYGLSKEEVDQRFDAIATFADIGDHIHQPVKTYSSGMYVRLAFAVIANVDADILVVDEALAVGDAVFTQKCMRYIRKFRENGTLLFVSHDMGSVLNLCDKAVRFDSGHLQHIGPAKDVVESYLQIVLQQCAGDKVVMQTLSTETETRGWQTGLVSITDVQLINLSSPSMEFFEGGEKVRICVTVEAVEKIESPIIGFLFRDRLGQDLFGENTLRVTDWGQQVAIAAGQRATARFDFTLPHLPNGQYAIACSVARGTLFENTQLYFIHDALIVTIASERARWGLVGIVCDQITIETSDASNCPDVMPASHKNYALNPPVLSVLFNRDTGKQAAKWHGYLQHYDKYFIELKERPLRILEIGIQAGGSLEVWAQYFRFATHIIGVDIDPACKDLCYEDSRIRVLIGDINATETLKSLAAVTATLDLVIDDGSHHSSDIICSFLQIFPRLTDGGIYLIEDLHCSYWAEYGGGLYHPLSAINFFKKIVDIINQSMWGVRIHANDFLADFQVILYAYLSNVAIKEFDWSFLADIHSIEFVNSICIIRKRSAANNGLGPLVLSGYQINDQFKHDKSNNWYQYEPVEMSVPSQHSNIYSEIDVHKKEENEILLLVHQEINRLKKENIALKTQVYEATKNSYESSVSIQKLEYQLKQLEKLPPTIHLSTNS